MNSKKIFVTFVTIVFVALSLTASGCAQLASVDKGYLNHPAMDLARDMTYAPTDSFTVLGSGGATADAGCATCAH